jgi:polar amino acid transport system substrate-binding protein
VEGSKVIGQFSAPGGDRWGALLEKDSELTDCVSQAIDDLTASGELERLTDKWITQEAGAPELD